MHDNVTASLLWDQTVADIEVKSITFMKMCESSAQKWLRPIITFMNVIDLASISATV